MNISTKHSPNPVNGKKKTNQKKKLSQGQAARKKKEAAAQKPQFSPKKDKVTLSSPGQAAGSQASAMVQGLQSSFA